MARRLSLADAFACAAAGVGSWLTRASLDVFPGAGGATRIAMFATGWQLYGPISDQFLMEIDEESHHSGTSSASIKSTVADPNSSGMIAQAMKADDYRGKRLNSPNDLVYRSDGTLYFTDPPFGLPKFFDDPRKELAFSGVFALTPAGRLRQ